MGCLITCKFYVFAVGRLVSFAEFQAFESLLRAPDAVYRLAFQLFDVNADGNIDFSEWNMHCYVGFKMSAEISRLDQVGWLTKNRTCCLCTNDFHESGSDRPNAFNLYKRHSLKSCKIEDAREGNGLHSP